MDPKIGCLCAALLYTTFACVAGAAHADSFDVKPVTLETKGGIETITVSNSGDTRIYIETSIYDWSKDQNGADVLTESDAAVASPPAMWVPPHASYLIRLRLPRPTANHELPFKVLLEQVPDRTAVVRGRVMIMIRQSLSFFCEPDAPIAPDLHAAVEGDKLYIENKGDKHAKIQAISQDGKEIVKGLLGYVLPGSRIGLKVPVHRGPVQLTTNVGQVVLNVQ